jgi:G3E family GTPase
MSNPYDVERSWPDYFLEHRRLSVDQQGTYQCGDLPVWTVYCPNGYLGNSTIIEGDDGLIVYDTGVNLDAGELVAAEIATISDKPVRAIFYSHHHTDHYNGTSAIVDPADVKAGAVDLYAWDNFTAERANEFGGPAQPSDPVDYVILEASGVADPAGVVMTFLDARHRQLLRLDSITCVVDAEGIFRDDDDERLTALKLRQIAFADLVVLNKTDLVSPAHIEVIRDWIDLHIKRISIIEAVHGDVPLAILLAGDRFAPGAVPTGHTEADDPVGDMTFDQWSYRTRTPFSRDALVRTVRRELPASVYRCKGIVYTDDDPGQPYALHARRPPHRARPARRPAPTGYPQPDRGHRARPRRGTPRPVVHRVSRRPVIRCAGRLAARYLLVAVLWTSAGLDVL